MYSRQCETCIFRPGNLMHLRTGRLKDVVESNLSTGTLLTCHETTHGQAEEQVMCRGFFDQYGKKVNVKRVMDRVAALQGYSSGFREVDPRGGAGEAGDPAPD